MGPWVSPTAPPWEEQKGRRRLGLDVESPDVGRCAGYITQTKDPGRFVFPWPCVGQVFPRLATQVILKRKSLLSRPELWERRLFRKAGYRQRRFLQMGPQGKISARMGVQVTGPRSLGGCGRSYSSSNCKNSRWLAPTRQRRACSWDSRGDGVGQVRRECWRGTSRAWCPVPATRR